MKGSMILWVLIFLGALVQIVLPAAMASNLPANRPVNDKWALVIGISKFADSSLDLKYSAKDAQDFYNYLITDGHFAKDHVKLLINEIATREQVLSQIGDTWLPKVAKLDDLVVIFISSHGSPSDVNVGGVNYILAHDTSKSNLYATGIAMQDLSQILKNRIGSDRLVLILDACHSGNAAASGKGIFRVSNVNVDEIAEGSGKTVISSSEPAQMSWESSEYPNGVFTHYLIDALHQNGSDTKLSDAYKYMKEKVQEEVLRDRGAMQTPQLRGTADSTAIAIAIVPEHPTAPPPGVSTEGLPKEEQAPDNQANNSKLAMISPAELAVTQARVWETYLASGVKARKEGRYAEAERMLKESIGEAEKFGSDSPRYAASLSELAELDRIAGQYTEAESLNRKALAIRQKALGMQVPEVAQSLNNLALLLEDKGRYSEAEPLMRQSLEIWKKKQGEESAETAVGLNNLARDLFDMGKYVEAEQLARRSLEISEKVHGLESPEVARSLVTLGQLYFKTGKYNEAKKMLQRSLDIREREHGPEHPDLIESINSLAEVSTAQRRYVDAEPLLYRSLAISEKTLGADHPHVADSLNQLALLYELRLKYPQAESNYKRALEIREKALGSGHPAVAQSLTNLAWLNYAQEQYPQADSLYRRAQAISEKALEPDNPSVATTLEYYVHLLRATSRRRQATDLQAKVKAMRAKHALSNPNVKLKTDSAILNARAYALRQKQEIDKKRGD
ncbi:MAG: tetratricopeptide repeat protein [Candidatus Melainabacteria bacterium]|nr:tetratricopeptide repeat protein [Candidatus Melainabacteria bacterium]